jgi:hypothetical protein
MDATPTIREDQQPFSAMVDSGLRLRPCECSEAKPVGKPDAYLGTSGLMSGYRKRGGALAPALAQSSTLHSGGVRRFNECRPTHAGPRRILLAARPLDLFRFPRHHRVAERIQDQLAPGSRLCR